MGKGKTVESERNKGAQPHWFVCFRRKSIVVSKLPDMVDITMAIFAAVHVNKICLLNPIFRACDQLSSFGRQMAVFCASVSQIVSMYSAIRFSKPTILASLTFGSSHNPSIDHTP
jgi:hypothetical protein